LSNINRIYLVEKVTGESFAKGVETALGNITDEFLKDLEK